MKRASLTLMVLAVISCGGKDRDVATGMNRETPALATAERDELAAYVGQLNHHAAVESAQVSVHLALYRYASLAGDHDGANAALAQVLRAREPASAPQLDVGSGEVEGVPTFGDSPDVNSAATATAPADAEPAPALGSVPAQEAGEASSSSGATEVLPQEFPTELDDRDESSPAFTVPESEGVAQTPEPPFLAPELTPVFEVETEIIESPNLVPSRGASPPAWQRRGALRE